MNRREQARSDALDFSRNLRDRGLYTLSEELTKAVDSAMFADAQAEAQQSVEAVDIYNEAERRMSYLVTQYQRTLEDIANAPLGRTGDKVRVFCLEFEPGQAVGLAKRIAANAYDVTNDALLLDGTRKLVASVYGETAS